MRATEASSQMLKQKTFNLLIAAPFLRMTSNGRKLDKEPNLQMTYWQFMKIGQKERKITSQFETFSNESKVQDYCFVSDTMRG